MSITVHVYDTPTSPEHLYKDLSTVISPEAGFTGDVRGDVSVDAPVILLQATILVGNYVHIPEFGRYYWITDRNIERTDLTELTLRSDPLMSFAGQILGLDILVERCTKQAQPGDPAGYNSLLPDGRIPVTSQAYYREFLIPGLSFEYPTGYGSSVNQYILGVIG